MGGLALLGIPSGSALAYAVILHLVQILVTAVFGLWGLIREGQNLSTLFSSLTEKKQVDELVTQEES